jgi:D-serine deaminase-like pyridoxal phosphate-dependent protein
MTLQADGVDRQQWIGSTLEDLDTPALLLDRAASDHNLRRMADFFRGRDCQLRPHFKNHKCLTLARRQLNAGAAVGMTCAKLGEAEVLADGGVDNVLIANQVVGAHKLARLVKLAGRIDLTVAVDDADQARALSRAATAANVTLGVLVEVDIGMNRCGVQPGEPALDLAQTIVSHKGLRFEGIQAFEGHAVYIDDPLDHERIVTESFDKAIQTRRLMEQSGIPVRTVSGGSSATYGITGCIDGVDELQAGSYATMDWRYAQVLPGFDVALSVLVSVISRRPGIAILDAGLKAAGCEFGSPWIAGHPEIDIPSFFSEEHCTVHNAPAWKIGRKLQLLPSHACTTCNLYRQMFVHEDGRIVDVWPIEASGKLT